jgi:hypothetical protein
MTREDRNEYNRLNRERKMFRAKQKKAEAAYNMVDANTYRHHGDNACWKMIQLEKKYAPKEVAK